MAREKGQRKSRRISLEQAKARQNVNFDEKPIRKERSLISICFSIALVTIFLGLFVFYFYQERSKTAPKSALLEKPSAENIEMDFKTPPVEWTGKFPKEIMNEFRDAKTVEEYLEHLDNLDLIEDEARKFFSSGPGSREKISQYIKRPPLHTRDGKTYIQLQALLESGDIRMFYLRWDPKGPKIDFHAYARQNSNSWEALLNGEVSEASEMRVGIRPDTFYLGEFQDDLIWQSFRALSPDLEDHLSLYMKKDAIPVRLQRIIDRNQNAMATIALRSVGDSHQIKQFEITRIHQLNWLSLLERTEKQTPPNE